MRAAELDPETVRVDRRLASALLSALKHYGSLDELMNNTADLIVWREFPANPTHETRIAFQLDKSRTIRVNYRTARTKAGHELILLENSFWKSGSLGRINPSLYSFTLIDGEVHLHFFQEAYPDSPHFRFTDSSPILLGLLEGDREIPHVALLYGPHGSGHFVRLMVFSVKLEEQVWTGKTITELSGVGDYSYHEGASLFSYSLHLSIRDFMEDNE